MPLLFLIAILTNIITVPISDPAGDGYERLSDHAMITNTPAVPLVAAGLRFTSVPLPAYAAIEDAAITLHYYDTTGQPVTICAQKYDAHPLAALPLTQRQYWPCITWQPPIGPYAAVSTPSLAPMLQSIVNHSSWTPGAAIVFTFWSWPPGPRAFSSYEYNTPALLHVEYTP